MRWNVCVVLLNPGGINWKLLHVVLLNHGGINLKLLQLLYSDAFLLAESEGDLCRMIGNLYGVYRIRKLKIIKKM